MKHKDLEIIYTLYYRPLYYYALSLCHHEEDAKDLVANTFLKALMSFKVGHLEAWLYKVLKNEFLQYYHKKKKVIQENEFNISHIPDDVDIAKDLILYEDRKWLYEKIKELSSRDQQIVYLKLCTDLKSYEIAEILEMSEDNVRMIYHRLKNKWMKEADYE